LEGGEEVKVLILFLFISNIALSAPGNPGGGPRRVSEQQEIINMLNSLDPNYQRPWMGSINLEQIQAISILGARPITSEDLNDLIFKGESLSIPANDLDFIMLKSGAVIYSEQLIDFDSHDDFNLENIIKERY
jgi:hypothetical protein